MRVPWSIHWYKGILILLDNLSLSVDPLSKASEGDFVLISHAHSDHIAGFKINKPKLTSYLTLKLYEAQSGRRLFNVLSTFLNSQCFSLGPLDIEVYESGHILGSVQFLFKHRCGSLAYTGDLNLEKTLVTNPGYQLECDQLIIDATYGHPEISFPNRELLYNEIADFVEALVKIGSPPAFLAYSIGKAQELIAIINNLLNLEVLIDEKIFRVNKIYEKHGFKFKYIRMRSAEGREALKSKSLPVIVSNKKQLHLAEKKGFIKAIATGWAKIYPYKNFHAAFPLSNHADFPKLVDYVYKSKAKRVYAVGYFAKYFANWIERRLNIRSIALSD